MPKDPVWTLLKWYLAGAVGVILIAMACGSCQVLKSKQSTVKDSTHINRMDSGTVRKTETTARDSMAWWREIVNFLPQRDTVINNITTPVTNYYPSQIIREGGVRTSEVKQVNYDSLWNNRLDSLVNRLSESTKSKESKTPWWVNAIIIFGFFFGLMILILIGVIIYKKLKS